MIFRGDRLRQLRQQRGWRLSETAQMLGYKPQYLSQVESGKKKELRESTVRHIASLFEVRPEYFYGEDGLELTDFYPDMPKHVRDFVVLKDNLPYLEMALEIKKSGISPLLIPLVLPLLAEDINQFYDLNLSNMHVSHHPKPNIVQAHARVSRKALDIHKSLQTANELIENTTRIRRELLGDLRTLDLLRLSLDNHGEVEEHKTSPPSKSSMTI